MATASDFDNINPNGGDFMARQWRYIARAVKALKPIWEGSSFVQLLGIESKTISNDLIQSWTKGTIYISPESGTTDNLIGVVPPTGLENGTFVTLRLTNGAHAITFKHNSGSTVYKFQLLDGIDYVMNSTDQRIMFMFKDNIWYEHMRAGTEDYQPATLLNSWSALATVPTTVVGYQKDSLNNVILSGAVTKTPNATSSTIFTLAAGYRPLQEKSYLCVSSVPLSAIRNQDIITVSTNGNVTWVATDSVSVSSLVVLQLDQVGPFRAQQ